MDLGDQSVNGSWKRFEVIVKGDDVIDKYDEWAKQYEKDYCAVDPALHGSKLTAEAMAIMCASNKQAKILDLCAGTGLVGAELKEMGFREIDALDGSQGMLDEAGKKGIYKNLIRHFLGKERIPIEDDTYDGITCHGGFYPGHVEDGSCFPELARIVKPGGGIVVVFRSDYLPTYEADLKRMASEGRWKYELETTEELSFEGKTRRLILIKIIVS